MKAHSAEALTFERLATEKELTAWIQRFEAECWRGGPRTMLATDEAHTALQRHLDAIAGQIGLVKKEASR